MSELGTKSHVTFLDLYRRGEASDDDIDDFIERWHEAQGATEESLSLYEYLGMSRDEYAAWVQDPASLKRMVQMRQIQNES